MCVCVCVCEGPSSSAETPNLQLQGLLEHQGPNAAALGTHPTPILQFSSAKALLTLHECPAVAQVLGQPVKNSPVKARDVSLIPGLGRSPRVGNGNPLQYSCLGNPMER